MNRTIAVLSALALSGLGACVVKSGPPPAAGSVSFLWTFNGGQSCELAGVSYVSVEIAGAGKQAYPCRDPNGVPGVTLDGIPSGPESFTLTGEDAKGNAIYGLTSSLVVQGGADTTVNADLATPTAAIANSDITLLWTFAGQGCTASGVANVSITIAVAPGSSQTQTTVVPCDYSGTDGATIQNFSAGSYPFTVEGLDARNNPMFQGQGTAYVDGQTSVSIAMDLTPLQTTATTGALSIGWTFGQQSCAAAGVDHIHVALFDSTGNAVANSDQTVLCSQDPSGISYDALAPDSYWVDVQGISGGVVAYQTVNYQVAVFAGSNVTATIDVQPKP